MRDSPALRRARMLGWVAESPGRTLGQVADEVAKGSPCSEALASLTVSDVVEAVLAEGWRRAAQRATTQRCYRHASPTSLAEPRPRPRWAKRK